MGDTSTDTRREIEELRAQTTALLVEIEGRVRRTLDVRAQIREHPGVAAGIGLGLSAGVGLIVFNTIRGYQQRRSTRYRAEQRLRQLADYFGEGLPFRVNPRDGRVELPGMGVEREPNFAQRLAWTAITTGGTALASYLARQLTEQIWQRGFGEPPPEA